MKYGPCLYKIMSSFNLKQKVTKKTPTTKKAIPIKGENRRLDNLTADKISKNRLDSHWPLCVHQSQLLFDGW